MNTLRSRHVRRVLVPVIAVSLLSACTGWKVQEMAPSQVVSEKEPGKIRLTMFDGEKIELYDPTVTNGEIVGHPEGWYDSATRRHVRSGTQRVPTDSVASIEILETDALATVGVVLGGLAAVAGLLVFIAISTWDWGGV
jgi:hypothetical protein